MQPRDTPEMRDGDSIEGTSAVYWPAGTDIDDSEYTEAHAPWRYQDQWTAIPFSIRFIFYFMESMYISQWHA